MIAIRPFNPVEEEYVAMAETQKACWPEYDFEPERIRARDRTRGTELFFARYTLFWNEGRVGLGAIYEPREGYAPGRYIIDILVRPPARRRGLGSAFYRFALKELAGLEPRPVRLGSQTREDQTEALAFLTRRGFSQVLRYPRSILETAAFDPDRFSPAVNQVADAGIRITTLADLMAADPDALRKFWELSEIQIMRDVPFAGEYRPRSYDTYASQFQENTRLTPETIFVALDGDRFVGMSGVFADSAGSPLWLTGLTGVLRDYRRRKIALALKVAAIENARRAGAARIETDNEENNPMYALNMILGFQPQPAWVELERPFSEIANT